MRCVELRSRSRGALSNNRDLAEYIVHMTLTFSSLILIRSLQSISRPILSSAPTSSNLSITRKMSDASKTKSENEWQAILTPEQVCLNAHQIRGFRLIASGRTVQGASFEGHRASWYRGVRAS